MFFDDRLATVLRQRATGEASLRTQFRQLLDLLGKDRTYTGNSDHSLLAAAWLRMDALADAIPAEIRARLIREPGWRFHSPDLAAHFADQEPEVTSAALVRAELTSEDWTALIPRLPVRARGFLRLRRDLPLDVEALLARLGVHDRGLPAPTVDQASDQAAPPAIDPAPAARVPSPARPLPSAPLPSVTVAPMLRKVPGTTAANPVRSRDRDDSGRTEISALVERIAQFRRTRGDSPLDLESSPRLPLGELADRPVVDVSNFGFATDISGRIAWAITEIAPMVIGVRLFTQQTRGQSSVYGAALARAFARRQPITDARISLQGAPAISGDWIVDAEPHFNDEGHFTGYLGRFRRLISGANAMSSAAAREADRIRQLLHELRTPVTAVQGYAEVIQQQLFGPAPHEYRALAAAIAADAARILAGFEELDRLARLETGATGIEPGETDLAALVRRTAAQLGPVMGQQRAGLDLNIAGTGSVPIGLDADDAEALIWRLLASLGSACTPDERIAVRLDVASQGNIGHAHLVCMLPVRLAEEENLFSATTRTSESAINAGLFGTGFALRLARAEARAAGGALRSDKGELTLTLPLLINTSALPGAANA